MKLRFAGMDVTLIRLSHTKIDMRVAATAALESAGKVLFKATHRNMSLRDHSLDWMRKRGHPYARRHGSIQIHKTKPYVVHRQSGNLVEALKFSVGNNPKNPEVTVFVDTAAAPHGRYVIQGTRVMLPRDVIWETAHEPEVKQAMMQGIVTTLGQKLRGKLGLRFGPGAMPRSSTSARGGKL